MQITVTLRNLKPSDALKACVVEKTNSLESHLIKPEQAHWTLVVEKKRQIAECDVFADGKHLVAKQVGSDLYGAIGGVIDKIAAQARTAKNKLERHKPNHRRAEAAFRLSTK